MDNNDFIIEFLNIKFNLDCFIRNNGERFLDIESRYSNANFSICKYDSSNDIFTNYYDYIKTKNNKLLHLQKNYNLNREYKNYKIKMKLKKITNE